MIRTCLTGLALGLCALSSAWTAPAHAAASYFGAGPALSCYQGALSARGQQTDVALCTVALETQPLTVTDRAATLVNRGVIRLHRKEAAAALGDFDQALRLNPELGEALVNRGAALIMLDRPQDAVAAITAGLARNAQDPHEALFNRAFAYEELGQYKAAYKDFREAQRLKPEWPAPTIELARYVVEPITSK
jgi:tetratricopeptide (TPR) repeat protein